MIILPISLSFTLDIFPLRISLSLRLCGEFLIPPLHSDRTEDSSYDRLLEERVERLFGPIETDSSILF